MKCPMCLQGYYASCMTPGECDEITNGTDSSISGDITDDSSDPIHTGRNVEHSRRSSKRDSALKDQQSTGRKRAAKLYPLDREAPCEWQNQSNNGGGPYPTIGCLDGKQEARHHGPDKSVTNNEQGNVHRICHACHYQWHAANDGTYDWNNTIVQAHAPVGHSEEDKGKAIMIHIKYMANKKKVKD